MSIEKTKPITVFGVKYFDKILYYKMKIIHIHFYRLLNLTKKFYKIRKEEIMNNLHENKESIININSNETKRILLIKIKNETNYIKKILMKKEYYKKVKHIFIDYDDDSVLGIIYDELDLHDKYMNRLNKHKFLGKLIHFGGDDRNDEVLEHVRNDEVLKDKVFKDIYKLTEKFEKYFVNCTDYYF